MIPAAEIARLREIAEKATPGPWKLGDKLSYGRDLCMMGIGGGYGGWFIELHNFSDQPTFEHDAAYIAAFDPPTVKALLAALEQSQAACSTDADAWLDLVEKTDRSSPPEYPDHALITREELLDYLATARADVRKSQQISDTKPYDEIEARRIDEVLEAASLPGELARFEHRADAVFHIIASATNDRDAAEAAITEAEERVGKAERRADVAEKAHAYLCSKLHTLLKIANS